MGQWVYRAAAALAAGAGCHGGEVPGSPVAIVVEDSYVEGVAELPGAVGRRILAGLDVPRACAEAAGAALGEGFCTLYVGRDLQLNVQRGWRSVSVLWEFDPFSERAERHCTCVRSRAELASLRSEAQAEDLGGVTVLLGQSPLPEGFPYQQWYRDAPTDGWTSGSPCPCANAEQVR